MGLANLEEEKTTNQGKESVISGEKDLWDKTKDFVSENFTAVATGEAWKKETGMNLFRTAGFLAAGTAALLAVKGAWNRMF